MNADIHDAFLAAHDWGRRDYPDPAVFAGELPRATAPQTAAPPSPPQDDAPAAKPPRRTRARRAPASAPLASRR